MSLDLLSDILELIGEILVVISVVRVHSQVLHDHKIDKQVLDTIKGEKRYAIVGLIFIVIAFAMRIILG